MQIKQMLEYNEKFVVNKNYEPYFSDTIPNRKNGHFYVYGIATR